MSFTVTWVCPSFFKVLGFPIQNFGLFIGLAFLASAYIVDTEFIRMGIDLDTAEIILIAMVTGVAGSKLHCTISEILSGDKITPLLSGSGLSFQGGFLGATLCLIIYVKFIQKKPICKSLDCMAPALVTGYAVGKIGCFVSGDGCYGIPTKHPIGMHFPNALVPTRGPVHPVPLYETFFNTILLIFLMVRARTPKGLPVLNNTGVMFIGLGTLRFLLEYVRGHPIIAYGMTEFQFIAGGMILWGVFLSAFSHTQLCDSLCGPRHVPTSKIAKEVEMKKKESKKTK